MVRFRAYFDRRYPQLERLIAIVTLINLVIIFFNSTYLSLRPVYKQYLPDLTQLYDPVKGVVIHPETQYYQAQVDKLTVQLAQDELDSPQIENSLAELRSLSQRLLTEGTFVAPNGEHTLATVQQALLARTGQPLARDAFDQFWSSSYLARQGWQQELEFWNTQIRPFLQANYYRNVNQFGIVVDHFWLIDLPFVLIFAVDIWVRFTSMRRRYPDLSWLDIGLRRWYDIFLLLPIWRWLRVLPVILRLHQVDFLNLEPVKAEVQRDAVVLVAADLAGIIGIQLIEQMQASIRQGEWLTWISPKSSPQNGALSELVDQEEVNEVADHLYDVSVQNILPRIQPDIEDLIHHSLTKTLEQMPGYPQLHHVPGLGQVSTQVVQQISNSVVQGFYRSMAGTLADAEGREITVRLQDHLREAIAEELSRHNTTQKIQSLLINALEDIKHNYVREIIATGGDQLAERTQQLRQQISS